MERWECVFAVFMVTLLSYEDSTPSLTLFLCFFCHSHLKPNFKVSKGEMFSDAAACRNSWHILESYLTDRCKTLSSFLLTPCPVRRWFACALCCCHLGFWTSLLYPRPLLVSEVRGFSGQTSFSGGQTGSPSGKAASQLFFGLCNQESSSGCGKRCLSFAFCVLSHKGK